MAGAPFLTNLPIERPSGNGTHFDEPIIEPFLAKHSQWYRRHSKVQAEADLAQSPQRNSSVASEATAESAAPAPTADATSTTESESRAERNARRSSVVKALRWAFWYNGNK